MRFLYQCRVARRILTLYSDPFIEMAKHNKTYGFTIAVKELRETVPNMFRYASAYMRQNNLTSKGLWEMFLEKPEEKDKEDEKKERLPEEEGLEIPEVDPEAMEGEKYNMCHFWSNFEIARLDFFRSKEYEDFFNMTDRSGGFWMGRVGFPINDPCESPADNCSGVMHRSILWPPELCSRPATFTTSGTLVTGTRPSCTARPMLPPGN